MSNLTRSTINDIKTVEGNGLALFLNVDNGLLTIKDVNGNSATLQTYTGIPITVGPIPPSNPVDGQLWVDTN